MRLENTSNISSSLRELESSFPIQELGTFSGWEGHSVIMSCENLSGNINEKWSFSGLNGVSSERPCEVESVLNISLLESSWYQLLQTQGDLESFLFLESSVYVDQDR